MKKLTDALNAGKRRGYEEIRLINGTSHVIQYAIKKQDNLYHTYYFSIEESRMDLLEDDEHEEIKKFPDLDAALNHLLTKGAKIEKLSTMKKSLPF